MTNYQYIYDLYKTVLGYSKAIEGRFYIAHRYGGQDINYDTFGEVFKDVVPDQKWPASVIMPPHSQMRVTGQKQGWETFRIIQLFGKQTYSQSDGQIMDANPVTLTSTHEVYQDWHDMKRCAINFLKALKSVEHNTKPSLFSLPPNEVLFIPFSKVGTDKISGVRVDYDFMLNTGCSIEDMEGDEYPTIITVNSDSHPEHTL